ncbi:glycosyltransferase [Bifidobacterium miconisargentati]|uniref:glycosyltransferase n=1 Tax=Bifidobacterium miconisargentati TaxID=2834437 RepID=UPI001BDD6822|nr:glycosyltransferase [Bifidobacterium miconisargentati]MBW3090917.1 glycosyltransferase [Bifidobacterium miconisargentati]
MRILHYALGFAPYRSGGLTRYVMDLMKAQEKSGHAVAMLWPGRMTHDVNPCITRHREVGSIRSYELRNPLPVVLDKPVGEPDAFHYPVDGEAYRRFLKSLQPDVVHIHTLQGLHREFLDAARACDIPTVFTTHDFFGLYPMNEIYPMDRCLTDGECSRINSGAPSLKKIRLDQSPAMRFIKSSTIVRKLFSVLSAVRLTKSVESSTESLDTTTGATMDAASIEVKRYSAFRDYEVSMLEHMNLVMYNSTVSKRAYERYCAPQASVVIPVIHNGLPKTLADRDDSSDPADAPIRIAFLGGSRPYKGLSALLEAVRITESKSISTGASRCWHLDVYGVHGADTPTVSFKPAFSDFMTAMAEEDVVIVPSQTYESFGFVALEALCAGMPVMATDCVGAWDMIPAGSGFSLGNGSPDEMAQVLDSLKRADICTAQENIRSQFSAPSFDEHAEYVIKQYKTVITEMRRP